MRGPSQKNPTPQFPQTLAEKKQSVCLTFASKALNRTKKVPIRKTIWRQLEASNVRTQLQSEEKKSLVNRRSPAHQDAHCRRSSYTETDGK